MKGNKQLVLNKVAKFEVLIRNYSVKEPWLYFHHDN